MRLAGAVLGLVLLAVPAAFAQDARATAGFVIEGQVGHPRTITLADLQALPRVTVVVVHDANRTSYTGALLWALISAAAPTDLPGDRTHVQHTILARGKDGYAAAFAIGELDPFFGGKQVVVAYEGGGKPLALPRLAVPGEAHPARSVKDLVSVEVR